MSSMHRYRFAFGMISLGVLSALLVDVCQRREIEFNPLQMVRRPSSVQTRDDAALLSGWLDQVDNSWEVGKNHQQVRSAFRDVVAQARKSTVRVFSAGNQVALGTIVDAAGLIVTKASEVKGSNTLVCQLYDRRKRKAEVVATLAEHDLALLRIEADRLVPVNWYTSQSPPVGSLLATPHLGREPLAVGVVSLAPFEVANDGVLGVRLLNTADGPSVTDVIADSAADTAGLIDGDLVSHIDEQAVANSNDLVEVIRQRLPGESISLRVRRGSETLELRATLGRKADLDLENGNFQSFLGGALSDRRTGFRTVLQHDTFLLPEHCGGPVVDLEGRVIGINIARAERIASYALPAAVIVPWIERFHADEPHNSLVVQ